MTDLLTAAIREAVRGELAAMLPELVEGVAKAVQAAQCAEKLSVAEWARRNGVSTCTARRKVQDGSLPSVKLGRRVLIPVDALKARGPEDIAKIADQARQSGAHGGSSPTVSAETRVGRCRQSRPLEVLP